MLNCDDKRPVLNSRQRRYRTPKGLIFEKYRSMRKRVLGHGQYNYSSTGKGLMTLEDFSSLCRKSGEFWRLYAQWILNEYRTGKLHRGIAPSVDRIDNAKGYVLGNVQIISNCINCGKDAHVRYRGKASAHYGVTFHKRDKRYQASINISPKRQARGKIYLGYSTSEEEAAGWANDWVIENKPVKWREKLNYTSTGELLGKYGVSNIAAG